MTETTKHDGAQQETPDPERIERDIEETREELGDTVAALAEKADVKQQARAKVDHTKEQAKARVTEVKETVMSKAGEAKAKAAEAAPESAGDAADAAQQYAQRGQTYASENPGQVAVAAAVATGFVLGWLWGRR
jgi:ElaB/YqjD/DUF883 family membrane-anchored ribosome-binding protein